MLQKWEKKSNLSQNYQWFRRDCFPPGCFVFKWTIQNILFVYQSKQCRNASCEKFRVLNRGGLAASSLQVEMLRRGGMVLVRVHWVVDGLDRGWSVHVVPVGAQLQECLVDGRPEVAEEEGGDQQHAQAHAPHHHG